MTTTVLARTTTTMCGILAVTTGTVYLVAAAFTAFLGHGIYPGIGLLIVAATLGIALTLIGGGVGVLRNNPSARTVTAIAAAFAAALPLIVVATAAMNDPVVAPGGTVDIDSPAVGTGTLLSVLIHVCLAVATLALALHPATRRWLGQFG